MLSQPVAIINPNNVVDILASMPTAGKVYLSWLLGQQVITALDCYVKSGIEAYLQEQQKLAQWADEFDNRYAVEK